MGAREEVGIIGEGPIRRIVPDVVVASTPDFVNPAQVDEGGGTAVLIAAEPRTELDAAVEIEVATDPYEVPFVEIVDTRTGREVVTIIEIFSPSNKQPGDDRINYVRKRQEILQSKTSLIEIDLLRSGERSWDDTGVKIALAKLEPRPDYLMFVDRAWRRGPRFRLQVFPAWLQRHLPVIAVPLRDGEPECTLDLQYAFQQTYDRGPYRRGAVDYGKPPAVPLPENLQGWAAEILALRTKESQSSR
jgi:hypothetical protein